MAILNILEFPDSRLRTIAKPVAVVDVRFVSWSMTCLNNV